MARFQLAPTEAHRSQILLGLNFYGRDFVMHRPGGDPVLVRDAMERLKSSDGLQWDAKAHEPFFRYRDRDGQGHIVYYPTAEVRDTSYLVGGTLGGV